jgi:hypothetical protein
VEAGSRSLGRSRAQPVRCECSPSVIQHVSISLEIKLSNMAYLGNGKGDNSTITKKKQQQTLSGPYSNHNFPVLVSLQPESGWGINGENIE